MLRQVLARNIGQLRVIHGLTQADLARAAHLAPSTVCKIESGEHPDLYVSTLCDLLPPLFATPDRVLGFCDIAARMAAGHRILSPRDFARMNRECGICHAPLAGGETHRQGDCILMLSEAGMQRGAIATDFGFTPDSIDFITLQEYARRLGHRR